MLEIDRLRSQLAGAVEANKTLTSERDGARTEANAAKIERDASRRQTSELQSALRIAIRGVKVATDWCELASDEAALRGEADLALEVLIDTLKRVSESTKEVLS